MLPHLLEILLVGQEAIQSYYPPVQIILILNGSPLVIKQWGTIANTAGGYWGYPLTVSAAYAISAIGQGTKETGADYTYYKVFDTTHIETILSDREMRFIMVGKA